jgi:hypothetical protein
MNFLSICLLSGRARRGWNEFAKKSAEMLRLRLFRCVCVWVSGRRTAVVVDETARRTPEGVLSVGRGRRNPYTETRERFFPPSSSGASMHTQHMKKKERRSHEPRAQHRKKHIAAEKRERAEARAKGKKEKLAVCSGTRKDCKKIGSVLVSVLFSLVRYSGHFGCDFRSFPSAIQWRITRKKRKKAQKSERVRESQGGREGVKKFLR